MVLPQALRAVVIAVAIFVLFARNGVFDDRWMVLVDVPTNFVGFETRHVWQAIFRGLANTLLAAVIALPSAALPAVALVSVRASRFASLRWVATGIIEVFRGLPVILVMFFGIFVLPGASPLMAVVFGLVLYNSAVFAEILRAGITALPAGQTEAAQSVGMGSFLIYRDIQLPQAVRMMLPLLAVGAAVYIALNISLSRLAVWAQHRSSHARRAPARVAVVGAPPVP